MGLQLPAPGDIVHALLKAAFLFFVADEKPILHENDARSNQHALEFGAAVQEFEVLVIRAKTHHVLDTSAVVPASIEENQFTACRKVRNVALKIPL